MRIFRSMLRRPRKNHSGRILREASKACVEGLESRLLFNVGNINDVGATTNATGVGQSVTLTATVNPAGSATGTVVFTVGAPAGSGGTQVGTTATTDPSTGVATTTTTMLPVGVDTIYANYTAGAGINWTALPGSMGVAGTIFDPITVNQITLISSKNPQAVGMPVTLTATITPIPNPGTGAAGTVTFMDTQTSPVPLAQGVAYNGSGVATFMSSSLPGGTNGITAVFTGDNNDAAAVSPTLSEDINSAGTTPSATAISMVSPASPTYGQPVTFTATVTGGVTAPTGTVNFIYGGNIIGSGTLSGGPTDTATFTTISPSPLPGETDDVTASYTGDTMYAASNSTASPTAVDVSTATSTTTVVAAPTSSVTGESVLFTATVPTVGIGAAPTGTVDFSYNGNVIGSGTLSGNQATFSTAVLPVGMDTVTANYLGDGNYGSSNNTASDNVTAGGTLASSISLAQPAASTYGAAVAFTATVTGQLGDPAPTGNVAFSFQGNVIGSIALNGGSPDTATFTTSSPLPVGSDTITAAYAGDVNYAAASPSATINETVSQGTPTTTVTVLPAMSNFDQSVTFTATVPPNGSGVAPTGTVDFFYMGAQIGSGNLNTTTNTATFTTTSGAPLPVGIDDVSATYVGTSGTGDLNYTTSSSSSPAVETVNPIPSLTTLATTGIGGVAFGTPINLTATVGAMNPVAGDPSPTGMVTFTADGTNVLGTIPVAAGTAVLMVNGTALAVGMHTIVASYDSGGVGYTNSVSISINQNVTPALATVSVSPSANPAPLLSSVALTAIVAPSGVGLPTPTGMVTFLNGVTVLAMNVPLVAGSVTINTSTLPLGSNTITVTYTGDMNYASSTSAPLDEAISQAVTTTALTSLNNPISFGGFTMFTATVSPMITGGPAFAMGDTVTFYNNVTGSPVPLGPPALLSAGGIATLNSTTLPVGADPITATFNGDVNYAMSTNPVPLTENVGVQATTTGLNTSLTSIQLGNPVTLTATVSPVTAVGTVSFYDGTTLIAGSPVTIMGGTAVLVTAALPLGANAITADYNGNGSFGGSTSTGVTVTVTTANDTTTLTGAPAAIALGAPVTFTATVAPTTAGNPTPTGTVTFVEDGTTSLGTIALVGGVAVVTSTNLALGTDSIVATYSGDPNYGISSSNSISESVSTVSSNTSATTLVTSVNPISPGNSVTFTATVAPAIGTGTPTGTVTFYEGTTALGNPVTLSNGVAVLSTTGLPTGSDYVTATYNGGNYSSSTSAPVAEIVGSAANFNTTLSVSNNSVIIGTPVTLVATVNPAMTGGAPATGGTVTFLDGTTSLGVIPLLSNGTAALTVTLTAGPHNITAAYTVGTSQSASTPIVVTVNSPTIPSIDGLVLPPDVVAGLDFKAKVPVLLANVGPKIKGTFIINLYANTGSTLDGGQVLVASMSKKLTLNSNQSKTLNAKLKLFPSSLPAGTYNILVEVIDPNGVSNLGRSIQTVGVLAPYVSLGPTVGAVTPSTIKVGKYGSVEVTVTNTGNEPVSGVLDLTLSPSTTGVSPVTGITLASLNAKVKFQAGQTRRYRLHFNTAALTAGPYQPYLAVSLAGYTATTVGAVSFTIT